MADLPPGWTVISGDGIRKSDDLSSEETDAFYKTQMIESLRYLEDSVTNGDIIGIGFCFISKDGQRAGYGWTAGCEEYPPLFSSNLRVFENHFFDQCIETHERTD